VVGWVGRSLGLKEYIVTEAEALAPVPPHMDDVEAAPLQPLACVLHAMTRLGDLTGLRAAVIGMGPIGLLYGHALKDRGVAHVTGIDLVDRAPRWPPSSDSTRPKQSSDGHGHPPTATASTW
jgi:L-iditol 2-dehydrogenase